MEISSKKIAVSTFGVMLVLVVLFNRSMCWLDAGVTWHKLFVAGLSVFGLVLMPILAVKFPPLRAFVGYLIRTVLQMIRSVRDHWREVLRGLLVYLVMVAVVCAFDYFALARLCGGVMVWRTIFLCGAASLVFALIAMRKIAGQKVELVFAVVALIIGLTTIFTLPRHLGITPDDETHYTRSISLASVFDYVKYEAETKMNRDYPYLLYGVQNNTMTYEQMMSYAQELDRLYGADYASNENIFDITNPNMIGYKTLLGEYDIAYIAPAVAIIIAKGLRFPFTAVFLAGKLGILLTYIAIIYYAIKRLRYGKVLLAVVGLLPTTMLFASSYSYDWWVIAWIIAGYSYYIAELQYRERKFTSQNLRRMICCFVVGVIPKWIYVILMFPLLFIPKEKFESDRQRKRYYIVMGIGAGAVLAFLVLPVFVRGIGMGDLRGGEGINATAQLAYVLQEPLVYLRRMTTFFLSYISLDHAGEYITYMGYLGQGAHFAIVLVLLGVLAFLDRDETRHPMPLVRVVHLLTIVAAVCLIITVFYLVYTPLGSDTVFGCQPRYLIPLLFPTLYFTGCDGVTCRVNRRALTVVSVALISIVYFWNYWVVYLGCV